MARIIFISLFLLLLAAIEGFAEEQEGKEQKDLKSEIISSLNDNEILIEGQLLTSAEDKIVRTLRCQGKYKLNDKNIVLACNEDNTFTIDGVATKSDKNIVVFNGCIKISARNSKSSKEIAISNLCLRNGEMITIYQMDSVTENKENDGERKGYYSKLELRISATWNQRHSEP